MTTRRKFFAFLASLGAAVVAAPLMRRKAEAEALGGFAGFHVGDFISFGDGRARFRITDVQGNKIRFVRSEPQIISGWDA